MDDTTRERRARVLRLALCLLVWTTAAVLTGLMLWQGSRRPGMAGLFCTGLAIVSSIDILLRRERHRVETIADLVQMAHRAEALLGMPLREPAAERRLPTMEAPPAV